MNYFRRIIMYFSPLEWTKLFEVGLSGLNTRCLILMPQTVFLSELFTSVCHFNYFEHTSIPTNILFGGGKWYLRIWLIN